MHPLLLLNEQIKREADQILTEQGLLLHLVQYGAPHVSGSFCLDLMTWRDLDIYLEADGLAESDFFILGNNINTALNPVKMSFRNERNAQTKGLPHGLYWGIYLGNERTGAWKIDIWAVDKEECSRLLDYCKGIERKLTPESRMQILEIKSQCWQDPQYRRAYNSMDIYNAVLDEGVTDIHGFREYLKAVHKVIA